MSESTKSPYHKLIVALSIVLPLAIAALFRIKIPGYDFSFFTTHLCYYQWLNGCVADSGSNCY
jgi:putative membrane protein